MKRITRFFLDDFIQLRRNLDGNYMAFARVNYLMPAEAVYGLSESLHYFMSSEVS